MDANNFITAAAFSAFIKCPTKAHLLAIGEPAPGTYFADIEARISSMCKAAANRHPLVETEVAAEPLEFGQLWRSPGYATNTHYIDCATAVYDVTLPQHKPGRRRPQESSPSGPFVPVLFVPWDKRRASPTACSCVSARSR